VDSASDSQMFVIEDSFGYLFNFVARLFVHMHAVNLEEYGISIGQWPILLWLWAGEGQTQTELSRHVVVDDATMVRTIDRMERDGLVQRMRNPNDRRQHNIYLTEKGRSLRDELIPCVLKTNTTILEALSESEQQQLLGMLRRIIHSQQPDALASMRA
jgi:DNA-binding MarR family transcriptional regulator